MVTVPVRGRVPDGRDTLGRDTVGRDIVRRDRVGREMDPAALIGFVQRDFRNWWVENNLRRLWEAASSSWGIGLMRRSRVMACGIAANSTVCVRGKGRLRLGRLLVWVRRIGTAPAALRGSAGRSYDDH